MKDLIVQLVCKRDDWTELGRQHETEHLDGRVSWMMLDKLIGYRLDRWPRPDAPSTEPFVNLYEVNIPQRLRRQEPNLVDLILNVAYGLGDARIIRSWRNEVVIQLRPSQP